MGKSPFSGIALDNNEGARYLPTRQTLSASEAQERPYSFASC